MITYHDAQEKVIHGCDGSHPRRDLQWFRFSDFLSNFALEPYGLAELFSAAPYGSSLGCPVSSNFPKRPPVRELTMLLNKLPVCVSEYVNVCLYGVHLGCILASAQWSHGRYQIHQNPEQIK